MCSIPGTISFLGSNTTDYYILMFPPYREAFVWFKMSIKLVYIFIFL